MRDNFSAANGLTAGNSANKIAERKTPPAGILPIPKHDWLTRKEATYSAMLSAISSRLGCQIGKDAHKGRFSCSRKADVFRENRVGPCLCDIGELSERAARE